MHFSHILYLCILIQLKIRENESISGTLEIKDKIVSFAKKGLGIDQFERYLKNLEFENSEITMKDVDKLASNINSKLETFKAKLKEMKDDIERANKAGKHGDHKPDDCASVNTQQFSKVLGDNINLDKWCVTGTTDDSKYILGKSFIEKWKDNYSKLNGIKYIKYGTEQGILYRYPAKRFKNREYDPRFRPWYVETVSPFPKDVVLMIDHSKSMSQVIRRAKLAAQTIINTLNPNDRVGVVKFNKEASTSDIKPCYEKELAKATDVTKQDMHKFLDNIITTSSTNYTKALLKAFVLMNNAVNNTDPYDTRQRDRVIIFLSDGDHDKTEQPDVILSTLRKENKKLNDTVVVLTFGVGGAEGSVIKNEELLKKMAEQNFTSGSDIPASNGKYVAITAPNDHDLRSSLAIYYNLFAKGTGASVKFTVPYRDSIGTGPQISMCLLIQHDNSIDGVLCIDIAIEYILSEVTYFRDDDGTYAFIIDAQTRVWSHPLLPNVAEQSTDFFFVYMSSVETGEETSMQFIRENMTRGGSSSKQVSSVYRVSSSGSTEGVKYDTFKATYFWHPIRVANLSIAITTTTRSKSTISQREPIKNLWYHADHHKKTEDNLCKAFSRIAAKDRAAVFLSTRCFTDPHAYVFYPQNSITQNEIGSFLTGDNNNNPGVKNSIRDTVSSVVHLEKIWQKAEYSDFIIWKYFATRSGIVITYPGLELAKNYDATIRPWFMGSVGDYSKYFTPPPYIDNWGAGTVVTLAKAVRISTSKVNYTLGVIAMDFTIQSFYYNIINEVEQCKEYECLVIDYNGYIIVHKDWIESNQQDEGDIHIVEKEPFMAHKMISENIMQKGSCIDMAQEYDTKIFWKMMATKEENEFFNIMAIESTNLFIIIVKKRDTSGKQTDCHNLSCSKSDNTQRCPSNKKCFCSCTVTTSIYDNCSGILKAGRSDSYIPPCAPRIPMLDYSAILKQERKTMNSICLKRCTDYDCGLHKQKEECSGVLSCQWASDTCVVMEEVIQDSCDKGFASWKIALIVIFILCVITFIIIFIILKRCQCGGRKEVIPDDITYHQSGEYLTQAKLGINNSTFQAENPKFQSLDSGVFEDYLTSSQLQEDENYSKIPADNNYINHTPGDKERMRNNVLRHQADPEINPEGRRNDQTLSGDISTRSGNVHK